MADNRDGADDAVAGNAWKRKLKGTSYIHTHPDALEDRAVVENNYGIYFNGNEYETLEAAKKAALGSPVAWRERDGDEWIYHDCEYVEARRLDKRLLEPLYASHLPGKIAR